MSNGWLCVGHNGMVQDQVRRSVPQRGGYYPVNRDLEMVNSILHTERKAIANGVREKVRLTAKGLSITYLT